MRRTAAVLIILTVAVALRVLAGQQPETTKPQSNQSGPSPARDAWSDPENPIRKIFKGRRLDLWSLKAPRRPAVPDSQGKPGNPPSNPIDAFVLAGLKARGLQPSTPADRLMLIRRLSFDLLGLPPSPEEARAFVADKSPDAYQRLVERLLASPHYGERLAQMWLDVVRYADSNSYTKDEFRPNIWRYRDYVVSAFNADKPYDRFIVEQLAGDELVSDLNSQDPADLSRLIATGYLRLGPWDSMNDKDKVVDHDQRMTDLVNTTGQAFLGLTMTCAKCHNHKYDPISQADYYRMSAFFAAVKPSDLPVVNPRLQAETEAHNALIKEEIAEWRKPIEAMVGEVRERLIEERRAKFPPEIIELMKSEESRRDDETKQKLKPYLAQLKIGEQEAAKSFSPEARAAYDALLRKIAVLQSKRRPKAMLVVASDAKGDPPATYVLAAGNYAKPLEQVQPGFFSVFGNAAAEVRPSSHERTTGRRLALANWIASPGNPWTARVMVNRLWQRHFGRGIVATPDDFGLGGSRPTHPELLDWLAREFIESGWSVKHIERLIVTSATYRQSSGFDAAKAAVDPDNELLWRQNPRRLDAEALRDATLMVAGELRPYASGRAMWLDVPAHVRLSESSIVFAETGGNDGHNDLMGWYADPQEMTDVRTLFLVKKRSLPNPMLQAFNQPDMTISCGRRDVTTVSPQALMLLNDPFAIRMAEALARRVAREAGPEASYKVGGQVEHVFWLTLGRGPRPEETALARELLDRHTQIHARAAASGKEPVNPSQAALVDLCRALLNTNEFIYID